MKLCDGFVIRKIVSISGLMSALACAMGVSYSRSSGPRSPRTIRLAPTSRQCSTSSPWYVRSSTLPTCAVMARSRASRSSVENSGLRVG